MYNTIKLEKGLYSIAGKTFTQALTELDPDKAYENTELKGLDAFERQLKRFDIRVSGAGSDRVEKFFISTESAVLFPEYVRRMIKKGMEDASLTSVVCAAASYTDGMDFRGLTVTKSGDDSVGEGESLPVTSVRLASSAKALTKFARKLSCSYESIRKQRLDSFGVILKNLGAGIAREVNALCMKEITSGVTPSLTVSGSSITYANLCSFWSSMKDFDMTVMVCTPDVMAKILALDEMKYCVSDFMSGGVVKTPYGVTIVKCPQLDDGIAVGIDSACAAEMIFGTDVIVDFDKLISSQCDEIACSVAVGFSVLTDGAVKTMKIS
jgi:hypothetical protein